MSNHKHHAVAFIASSLFAGATWAASFSFHAMTPAGGCPTAVESNEKNAHPEPLNPENRGGGITEKKTLGEADPLVKGQHGLLLPAVKQGSNGGQKNGDANMTAEKAGAASK